jgi:hypothetical protein
MERRKLTSSTERQIEEFVERPERMLIGTPVGVRIAVIHDDRVASFAYSESDHVNDAVIKEMISGGARVFSSVDELNKYLASRTRSL